MTARLRTPRSRAPLGSLGFTDGTDAMAGISPLRGSRPRRRRPCACSLHAFLNACSGELDGLSSVGRHRCRDRETSPTPETITLRPRASLNPQDPGCGCRAGSGRRSTPQARRVDQPTEHRTGGPQAG